MASLPQFVCNTSNKLARCGFFFGEGLFLYRPRCTQYLSIHGRRDKENRLIIVEVDEIGCGSGWWKQYVVKFSSAFFIPVRLIDNPGTTVYAP